MRSLGLLVAVLLLVSGCGDAGRKETGAQSTTAKPKLALIFTPQFKDGSWGRRR